MVVNVLYCTIQARIVVRLSGSLALCTNKTLTTLSNAVKTYHGYVFAHILVMAECTAKLQRGWVLMPLPMRLRYQVAMSAAMAGLHS